MHQKQPPAKMATAGARCGAVGAWASAAAEREQPARKDRAQSDASSRVPAQAGRLEVIATPFMQ